MLISLTRDKTQIKPKEVTHTESRYITTSKITLRPKIATSINTATANKTTVNVQNKTVKRTTSTTAVAVTKTSKPTTIATQETTTTTQKKINLSNTYYEIPLGDTSFHSYMSYRAITNTASPQYRLQQKAYTDEQGIRCVGKDKCIAVGSYYSTTIGDRFKITLSSGNSFTAIVADGKSDMHTDSTHMFRPVGYGKKNVIEFVVDTSKLDSRVRQSGNIGTYSNYNGNVVSIQKIN